MKATEQYFPVVLFVFQKKIQHCVIQFWLCALFGVKSLINRLPFFLVTSTTTNMSVLSTLYLQ